MLQRLGIVIGGTGSGVGKTTIALGIACQDRQEKGRDGQWD